MQSFLELNLRKYDSTCLKVFAAGCLIFAIAIVPFAFSNGGIFVYFADYNLQQIPFYTLAHRAVKNGDFFWNWNIDLGGSMIESYAFYLWGSPFFWLSTLFPESALPYLLPILLMIKYGIAALGAFLFTRRHVKRTQAAVIGGLLYAFSGFQGVNIVFNHFHDVTAFFPFLLIAFEEMLDEGKRGRFAVMTAFMAVLNYYFFFGQVVFLGIYFFCRYLMKGKKENRCRLFLKVLAEGIIGFMLSAFFLLPAVIGIIGNHRVSNIIHGYHMLLYPDLDTPLAIWKSLFFPPDLIVHGTLFSSGTTAAASVSGYLPLFAITGVIAFFAVNKKHFASILLLICGVMAVIPVCSSLFSALNSSFYARWYYMPVLIMSMVTAKALEETDVAYWKKGTYVTIGMSGLMIIWGCVLAALAKWKLASPNGISERFSHFLVEIACVIILLPGLYCLIFKIMTKEKEAYRSKSFWNKALCITLFACLITTLAPLYMGNLLVSRARKELFVEQMFYKKPMLEEETFYRIETDDTMVNYPMVWGQPCITSFISTISPSIMEFYQVMGVNRTVSSDMDFLKAGIRSLLSAKYYVENDMIKDDNNFFYENYLVGYKDYRKLDSLSVYENTNFIPMGFTFDTYILNTDFEKLDIYQRDRMLVKALILTEEQREKYEQFMIPISYERSTRAIGNDEFANLCQMRKKSAADIFITDTRGFYSEITLKQDNLVFFSVPYDPGFKAYVDGTETFIEKVNYGFMAVLVPKGTHSIQFTYQIWGWKEGTVISVWGICCLVVYKLYGCRKRKAIQRSTDAS